MRNKKAQGFTLIELLIVIAIIGILAAVLIPNLMNARSRAFDTAAQACAKEILTAAEIEAIDNPNAGYAGFTTADATAIHNCDGLNPSVTTATANFVQGTVTSRSNTTFYWSNTEGIGDSAATAPTP